MLAVQSFIMEVSGFDGEHFVWEDLTIDEEGNNVVKAGETESFSVIAHDRFDNRVTTGGLAVIAAIANGPASLRDVYVPEVRLATRRVLITDWVEGERLSQASQPTIKKLVPLGTSENKDSCCQEHTNTKIWAARNHALPLGRRAVHRKNWVAENVQNVSKTYPKNKPYPIQQQSVINEIELQFCALTFC